MISYTKVSDAVVNLKDELVAAHHPHLAQARILILFRDPPAEQGGRTRLGQARKMSDLLNGVMGAGADLAAGEEYDFLIDLAQAPWESATPEQRRALLDHEFLHCVPKYKNQKKLDENAHERRIDPTVPVVEPGEITGWRIRRHAVEAFPEEVQRHGLWRQDLQDLADVIQDIGTAFRVHREKTKTTNTEKVKTQTVRNVR